MASMREISIYLHGVYIDDLIVLDFTGTESADEAVEEWAEDHNFDVSDITWEYSDDDQASD